MPKPTSLPQVALDNAAGPAQEHLPTVLPPTPAPPTEVTPEQHALDAVEEHVALLGAAPHLPDFFGLV